MKWETYGSTFFQNSHKQNLSGKSLFFFASFKIFENAKLLKW